MARGRSSSERSIICGNDIANDMKAAKKRSKIEYLVYERLLTYGGKQPLMSEGILDFLGN